MIFELIIMKSENTICLIIIQDLGIVIIKQHKKTQLHDTGNNTSVSYTHLDVYKRQQRHFSENDFPS